MGNSASAPSKYKHTQDDRDRQLTAAVRIFAFLLVMTIAAVWSTPAWAISFDLDSIATWGKFPRFCVNTYRWGDKFFNSYDSLYVQGSGKKFNIKTKVESWGDAYNFRFEDGYKMEMMSRPSTSLGFYVTYMAVSAGYDLNVSKYLGLPTGSRKKFNFQFNCSLFAVDLYQSKNDAGTTIKRMGPASHPDKVNIEFNGVNSSAWGADIYYFFNHKRYSQGAAFSYSKIQMRSAGSFYAGLSFWGQSYDFDFHSIITELNKEMLPDSWNYKYSVRNKNYAFRLGYAYNWVFRPGFALCVSEAPVIGIRVGYINDATSDKTTFSLINRAKISTVYNHKKKWFFGIVAFIETGLVYDKEHTLIANNYSIEASVGYRFNLW